MIFFNNLKKCETCQGVGQLVQTSGRMKGYIIPCPDCAGSWRAWSNQYGTDEEDGVEVYVDLKKGIFEKVEKKNSDFILLANGKEIPLK